MDDDLKENLTASETWIRGFFILLFVFLLVIARVVTGAVVVIQFLFTVFSGQTNENLQRFGASLSVFIYQAVRFLTYNSETKPFPFTPWPQADADMAYKTTASDERIDEIEAVEEELGDESGSDSAEIEPDEHEPR